MPDEPVKVSHDRSDGPNPEAADESADPGTATPGGSSAVGSSTGGSSADAEPAEPAEHDRPDHAAPEPEPETAPEPKAGTESATGDEPKTEREPKHAAKTTDGDEPAHRDEPEPGDTAQAAGAADDEQLAGLWSPRRPRVVIKADLLPALSVVSVVSILGPLLGFVWSRLAPPQLIRVLPGGEMAPLPLEGYHSFDDFGIFALMSLGLGLLTGFVLWRFRQRRGPVLLLAAVAGAAISGWLAMSTGISFASGLYPLVPVKVGDLVTQPPALTSGWLVIVQPMGTALAYGTAAAWCGMDDLGRRLS